MDMNHTKILKRAFSITWNYRALWVFGILLALTLTHGSWNGGGNSGGNMNGNNYNGGQGFSFQWPGFNTPAINTIISIGIALICIIFLLCVVAAIVRYVSEVSLMRMVDANEETGEKTNVRGGFRLGWSRRAWRLFLIDLLVGVVGFIVVLLSMVVAAAPLLVWLVNSQPLRILGTVVAIGMIFLVILLFIAIGLALSVVMQFIRRAAALEDLGVFDSFRRGFALVRQRLGDIAIMALILFTIGMAWIVAMIPVVILLLLAAVVLGGLPGLFAGFIASLFTHGAVPYVIGGLVGLPIFLLVIIAPTAFLNGLMETYKSSAWTLTYREVLALNGGSLKPKPVAPLPEEPADSQPGENMLGDIPGNVVSIEK
jgi:hypothetical protein